ncbi:MAG TPA: amidase family protein, partial [Actinomycetota bacterium]|nr:amidase family protein [Actinomycetota bacterium]
MTELCDLSAAELTGKLRAGEISAVSLAESSIARREALDEQVGAFLTPTPQVALERAAELDTYLATGAPQSAVAGIPLALKDVLTTNGIRTTCGSRILETYV